MAGRLGRVAAATLLHLQAGQVEPGTCHTRVDRQGTAEELARLVAHDVGRPGSVGLRQTSGRG